MEPIKVSIEVNLNLSDAVKAFITGLFSAATQPAATQPAATQPVATQPVAAQPAATQPAATQSVAAQSVAAQPAHKNIEDVRTALAKKVNTHRDVIKAKLNEFGAPSVTKLDPDKYDDMYNFLMSL